MVGPVRTAAVYHACDTVLQPLDKVLANFLSELGMTPEHGFASFNLCPLNTRRDIAMLGIMPDDTGINWTDVVFKGLNIKGIYGREMYETWYKMVMMIQSGLPVERIITHRLHYTEFQEGFDIMRSGQSGKIILDWKD